MGGPRGGGELQEKIEKLPPKRDDINLDIFLFFFFFFCFGETRGGWGEGGDEGEVINKK